MDAQKLKTHLLVTGKATFYQEGGHWAASFSKFFGFGRTGDEALDMLVLEICNFKQGLDHLETKIEIDHGISQQIVGNATIQ